MSELISNQINIMDLTTKIMEEMEQKGFTQEEAEALPGMLERKIKRNSERFIKEKPFAIYRD